METMIPIIRPYGSINYKCIKGIAKSKRFNGIYYVVDTEYNYFQIDENTYLNLSKDYPNIETKRKGV